MEYNTFQQLDQTNFEDLHDQAHTQEYGSNDFNHRVQGPIVTTIVWRYIDIEVLTSFTSKIFKIKRKTKILLTCIASLECV